MRKIIVGALLFMYAGLSYGKTCTGQIKEVNHWSDGQEDRINFTLVNGDERIKVSTKTKAQVSMVLMAFASSADVKVYWSCTGAKPPSCDEQDSYPICGYIALNKYN